MRWGRRVSLACLLIFAVNSLAFCGWDAFKKSSVDALPGGQTQETVIVQPQMSSNEDKTTEEKIESASKNCSESSDTYDEVLQETKEAIEKVEAVCPDKAKEIEEVKVIVEELVISKAKMDEDYDILDEVIAEQAKALRKAERKLDGINFGLGLSLGYKPMSIISPGITMQMRSGSWTFRTDLNYDMDIMGTRAALLDPMNLEVRVGIIYEF